MRIRLTSILAVAVLSFAFSGSGAGHHSQAAAFFMDQWVEIEGTVRQWLFRNPHPVLYVEVIGENDEPLIWQIEFAPATVLSKRGWTTETFQPGDEIEARGHPSRAPGTHGMAAGAEITRTDGRPIQ
jgi:hypothetical protein